MTNVDAKATAGAHVEPLDPNTDHGREVAERLADTLADLLLAVRAREAAAQQKGTDQGEQPAA